MRGQTNSGQQRMVFSKVRTDIHIMEVFKRRHSKKTKLNVHSRVRYWKPGEEFNLLFAELFLLTVGIVNFEVNSKCLYFNSGWWTPFS